MDFVRELRKPEPPAVAGFRKRITGLATLEPGTRNHELNKVSFIGGTLIAGGEAQEPWVREMLIEACESNGYIADSSETEAWRVIEAGLKSGMDAGPVRDNPVFTWAMTTEQLNKLPPATWLVDGVLMENSLAVVFGAPGCGKSFLSLDLMGSVANRKSWNGHGITHNRPGLYVLGEGVSGLKDRVHAWETHYGTAMSNVSFIPRAIQVTGGGWDHLVDYAAETKPGLVVIDTLARMTAGLESENDASNMGKFVGACDAVREASGGTVLVVHHSNRQGGMRGSNALDGAADTIIRMDKDYNSGRIDAALVKNKEGESGELGNFQLRSTGRSAVLTSGGVPWQGGEGHKG